MASGIIPILQRMFLFLLLTAFGVAANAQQIIKGKIVHGENGEPLPGATVSIKGSSLSQTTNNKGEFSISANREDILTVSYVGFEPLEVTAGNASLIRLTSTTLN